MSKEFNDKLDCLLQQAPDHLVESIKKKITKTIREHDDSLIVFGTGELGLKTAQALIKEGKIPLAFVDNKRSVQGTKILGIPVLSPAEGLQKYPESLVVVAIFTNTPVLKQLQDSGIDAITFAELAWTMPESFLPFCSVEYPHKIFNNRDEIVAALDVWEDDKSKEEYLAQITWRTFLDREALPPHEPKVETYFPNNLFTISKDEVFVDCGSYDGDSIRDFINFTQGIYRKIIAVEPDPHSRAKIDQWKASLPLQEASLITVIPEAASDKEGTILFNATGTVGSSMGNGTMTVTCAPLDKSIMEYHPTFIKMDIEGAEPEAIRGASMILQEWEPILAICLYHAQEHLWEIPLLIKKLNPNYRLFLRRYADECWETVCYAIPTQRLK